LICVSIHPVFLLSRVTQTSKANASNTNAQYYT
jgi:hypothetical protein